MLKKHHQATMEGGWGGWRRNLCEKSDHLMWETDRRIFFLNVIIFHERQTDRQIDFFLKWCFFGDKRRPHWPYTHTDHHHHCRRWSLCSASAVVLKWLWLEKCFCNRLTNTYLSVLKTVNKAFQGIGFVIRRTQVGGGAKVKVISENETPLGR